MMPYMIHKGLTPERWFKFTLFEQLANIGCEIDRTIRWKNEGRFEESKEAFERALELLTLTILNPDIARGARKELVRTRYALIDHFVYSNEYNSTDEQWHNYFFDFSYAAAMQREKKRTNN